MRICYKKVLGGVLYSWMVMELHGQVPLALEPRVYERFAVNAGQMGNISIFVDSHQEGDSTLDIVTTLQVPISVEAPDGMVVTAMNAQALGYEWETPQTVPPGPMPTPFETNGFRTLMRIPQGKPIGLYRVRLDGAQTAVRFGGLVTAYCGSPVRMAVGSPVEARTGEPVTLRTVVVNQQAPIAGAQFAARVTPIVGQPADRIGNYQLDGQETLPDGSTRYRYRATLFHRGQRIQFATAKLVTTGPNRNASPGEQDELSFGPGNPTQNLPSLNFFEIVTRNGIAPPLGALVWKIENALESTPVVFGDGGAFDALAGDGIFSASFTPPVEGEYFLEVRAQGTSPWNWIRDGTASFQAIRRNAGLGTISSQLVDTNGNGRAEIYRQNVEVNVTEAGGYTLELILGHEDGDRARKKEFVVLAVGSQTVALDFEAAQIRELVPQGGPLQRLGVYLSRTSDDGATVRLDERIPAGTTEPIALNSLEAAPYSLTGPITATGVRTTGTALFDELHVSVPVNTPGGDCRWSGSLRRPDARLKSYPTASGFGNLPAGASTLLFQFSGAQLRAAGLNGPLMFHWMEIACRTPQGETEGIFNESPVFGNFHATDFVSIPADLQMLVPTPVIAMTPGSRTNVRVGLTNTVTGDELADVSISGFPNAIGIDSVSGTRMSVALPNPDYLLTFETDGNTALGTYAGNLRAAMGTIERTIPMTIHVVSQPVQLNVTPVTASLTAGQSLAIQATVTGGSLTGPQAVMYSIEPQMGELSNQGIYKAPTLIDQLRVVRVRVRAVQDLRQTAVVTITLLPANSLVLVTQDPRVLHPEDSVRLEALVGNSPAGAVNWTASPSGTVDLEVTQPGRATVRMLPGLNLPASVTVTGTSVANPALTASMTIDLRPSVIFSLSGPQETVQPGVTTQLAVTIQNAVASDIIWSLDPPLGTISASGLYTAPSSISNATTVRVSGAVKESPTKRDAVDITIAAGTVNSPPAPWTSALVGGATAAGDVVAFEDNAFRLGANGCCWLAGSDAGMILSRPLNTDAIITMRLRTVGAALTEPFVNPAVAGMQVRASTDAAAVHGGIYLLRNPSGRLQWGISYRVGVDGPQNTWTGAPFVSVEGRLPDVVKLVRAGDQLTAYQSTDNRNWRQLGLPVRLPAMPNPLLSLFTSNTTATMDAVSIRTTSDFLLSAPVPRQDTLSGGQARFEIRSIPLLGFGGGIQYVVAGTPLGASAEFSAAPAMAGQVVQLTVATGAAVPGAYPLTVTAQSGTLTKTLILTLVVTDRVSMLVDPAAIEFNQNGRANASITLSKIMSEPSTYRLSVEPSSNNSFGSVAIAPPALTNRGAIANLEILGLNTVWSQGDLFLRASSPAGGYRKVVPFTLAPPFRVLGDVFVNAARSTTAVVLLRLLNSYPGATNVTLTNLPPGFEQSLGTRTDRGEEATQRIILSIPPNAPLGLVRISGIASQAGVSQEFNVDVNVTP